VKLVCIKGPFCKGPNHRCLIEDSISLSGGDIFYSGKTLVPFPKLNDTFLKKFLPAYNRNVLRTFDVEINRILGLSDYASKNFDDIAFTFLEYFTFMAHM